MTENLQESVSQQVSQLPMLVRESLEPLHSYLMQFNVFKHIDGVMMGIYDWVSKGLFSLFNHAPYQYHHKLV